MSGGMRRATVSSAQRGMCKLHPAVLGVEPRFCAAFVGGAAQPPPVLAAAAALSDFTFHAAAVDQLLCLYRAVSLVHALAAESAGAQPSEIGADSLLPLLVWTVVHSSLPHAFAALDYADQLSTREQKTSELGYYLACLQGACGYVLEASPRDTPETAALTSSAAVATPAAAAAIEPTMADGGPDAQPTANARRHLSAGGDPLDPTRGAGEQAQPEAIDTQAREVQQQQHEQHEQQQQQQQQQRTTRSTADSFALPSATPTDLEEQATEREALAKFLQNERAVEDLVVALAL